MMIMNIIFAVLFIALMAGFNIFLAKHYTFFVNPQF